MSRKAQEKPQKVQDPETLK